MEKLSKTHRSKVTRAGCIGRLGRPQIRVADEIFSAAGSTVHKVTLANVSIHEGPTRAPYPAYPDAGVNRIHSWFRLATTLR